MHINHRTTQRPLFTALRPDGPKWTWHVVSTVASSGYVTFLSVEAFRHTGDGTLRGQATADVALHHDVSDVIQFLAVEAMLLACQPNLFDTENYRHVVYQP